MTAIGSVLDSVEWGAVAETLERDGLAVVRGMWSAEGMEPIQAQWLQLRGPLANGQVVDGIRRDNFYIHGRLPVFYPKDLPKISDIDAVVALCSRDFGLACRLCESYLRHDILFVPGAREALVAQPVRDASTSEWAVRSSILGYLQASGLRGHFAEFGTFWGRAFFNSYYELHLWLEGKFFAFDSFAGLSDPDPRELEYTNGDFKKGAYGVSRDSFAALADILGLPRQRIVIVPGFFETTLTPHTAATRGLAPRSVSVCRIDCDLLAPSRAVLQFITPLLDDGALVYFDDWRLCRADPNLGERGAVLQWLKANPSFELVDFHSSHMQHQWFIFNRQKAGSAGSAVTHLP